MGTWAETVGGMRVSLLVGVVTLSDHTSDAACGF